MKEIRFPSVHKPNTWYTYHRHWSDLCDVMTGRPISEHAGWYDTLGDGTIQHTPEYAVQNEALPDYIASLFVFLSEATTEEVETVLTYWVAPVDSREILFLQGMRYKADKQQRFCRSERRVSMAGKYAHDERWLPVPEYADGSIESVLALLCLPRWSIDRYSAARDVEEAFRLYVPDARYCYLEAESQIGIIGEEAAKLRAAWDGLNALIRSYQLRENANNCLEKYRCGFLKIV